ncbi:serine/threonine protein kinase, partial [Streptomyces sp. NPDC004579]
MLVVDGVGAGAEVVGAGAVDALALGLTAGLDDADALREAAPALVDARVEADADGAAGAAGAVVADGGAEEAAGSAGPVARRTGPDVRDGAPSPDPS